MFLHLSHWPLLRIKYFSNLLHCHQTFHTTCIHWYACMHTPQTTHITNHTLDTHHTPPRTTNYTRTQCTSHIPEMTPSPISQRKDNALKIMYLYKPHSSTCLPHSFSSVPVLSMETMIWNVVWKVGPFPWGHFAAWPPLPFRLQTSCLPFYRLFRGIPALSHPRGLASCRALFLKYWSFCGSFLVNSYFSSTRPSLEFQSS